MRPGAAMIGEGAVGGHRRGNAATRQLIIRLINVQPHDIALSQLIVQHARPLHHLAGRQIWVLPCLQR